VAVALAWRAAFLPEMWAALNLLEMRAPWNLLEMWACIEQKRIMSAPD
jgi:hypothetical protein